MRVLGVWFTAIVLALSNWPAVAIVLDVDDPSESKSLESIQALSCISRVMY